MLLAMLVSWNVFAQTQQISTPVDRQSNIQKTTKAEATNKSIKPGLSLIKPITDGQLVKKNEDQEKGWFYKFIEDPIATFTGLLFVATVLLWLATRSLWKDAKRSSDVAFVASMPILSPLIVPEHTNLHPVIYYDRFRSHVAFVFENFGKTPAMIREVRADIFLCEEDAFPKVDFGELPYIGYEPIVAGESRGEKALIGVAECNRDFELTETEFKELLAEATGKYRRMAFIGQVVYDDFVGIRHTRRFCVKTRLVPVAIGETHFFQLVRGGREYNQISNQKIPKNELS